MVCGIGYAVRKTKISDWYNAVRKAKKLNWYDAVRKTYTCVDTLSFIQMLKRSSWSFMMGAFFFSKKSKKS